MARKKLAGAALAAYNKKRAGGGAVAKRKVARARKNPPTRRRLASIGTSLAPVGAAMLGGLLGVAANALFSRVVTNPTVQDVGRVVTPAALAFGVTKFKHPQARAFALGLCGVTGYAVGQAVSEAVVRRNPPDDFDEVYNNPADIVFDNPLYDEVFDNPPESIANEGYALFRPAWTDPLRVAALG